MAYTYMSQSIVKKTQHRNSKQTLEAGTEAEPLQAHIQLCFYTSQDQCPHVTLPTVSWGISTVNQENSTMDFPAGESDGGTF